MSTDAILIQKQNIAEVAPLESEEQDELVEYRNTNEKNYYGSDYNKYLRKECRTDMTVINIDCVQLDWDKKILRIIESKHDGERIDRNNPQFRVLMLLADVFRHANKIAKQYDFQIYLVVGSPPYNEITIENLITHNITVLTGDEVLQFSELELSL